MLRLTLERMDNKFPRMSTILSICKEALDSNGYKVEYGNDMHQLLVDPERGALPEPRRSKSNG